MSASGHMSEMVRAMGEIEQAGTSITEIIRVIDEITEQTNLLALNAAGMIAGSAEKTRQGATIAATTSAALGEILSSSAQVSTLLSEIARASQEQASGFSEVCASASVVLREQAANLVSLVSRFRVRPGASSGRRT